MRVRLTKESRQGRKLGRRSVVRTVPRRGGRMNTLGKHNRRGGVTGTGPEVENPNPDPEGPTLCPKRGSFWVYDRGILRCLSPVCVWVVTGESGTVLVWVRPSPSLCRVVGGALGTGVGGGRRVVTTRRRDRGGSTPQYRCKVLLVGNLPPPKRGTPRTSGEVGDGRGNSDRPRPFPGRPLR